ncbi:MAG TPA: recombinase family protein [Vicinamibacteria bacterium]|nr:recombinase family protein [Vicinamibacteria bacterium]
MSEIERWREPISSLPSSDTVREKEREGWRAVAIEWERGRKDREESRPQPIPYGLRISPDCRHLEVDPVEKEIMQVIVAMIAADYPLSRIASELNGRGFTSRAGSAWTQVAVFRLLPRIIEFGPEILSAREWSQHKERLLSTVT